MIHSLKKHHIGIVIPPGDISIIEKNYGATFIFDNNQKTRVCMVACPFFAIPVEYVVKEGRGANYEVGFHHICYQVETLEKLEELKVFIKVKKIGYRLTKLEESPLKECGHVIFFVLHNFGIFEVNVAKVE